MHEDPRANMRQLAARQYGILRTRDLASMGIGASSRHQMCQTGELERPYQAVYQLGGVPWSWEGALLTYCWAQNPGGYASHRSAARLWGVSGFDDRVFDVLVSRHARHPRVGSGFRLHETGTLLARDVTSYRGMPVTSPARTIVDVAATVGEERVEYLVESLQRLKHCSIDEIEEAVDRLASRGQRGARKLRSVLSRQGNRERNIDSQTNLRMRKLLTESGFDEPEMEYPIRLSTGWIYADLAYPRQMIMIECVSQAFHLRESCYSKDNARRNELIAKGWLVLEFTWHQVFEKPDATLEAVRAAFTARQIGEA